MLSLLVAAAMPLASAEVIPFENGTDYVVSIRRDTSDWGTAYLIGKGSQKPIAKVTASPEIQWFWRRDGSAVLLLDTVEAMRAFTITATGKVYPHKSPWNFNASIRYSSPTTAVLQDHAYTGEEPPSGRVALVTMYVWSKSHLKWLSRPMGYS